MPWHLLKRFRDRSVPKLDNLRRAEAAGLRVPATWWQEAAAVSPSSQLQPPAELVAGPLIIRSGSPTEDQRTTSNAGQLLSLPVRDLADFADALRRVVAALPLDSQGRPRGAVFVQPLLQAREAGVAFFDGFYYERTLAAGSNEDLTSGQARGQVSRGHLLRGEPWSQWLAGVYSVFGGSAGDPRIDVEFARDTEGFVLLQVRPALFPVERNETLTLANHKETLGELPSPWMVSALVEAGRDLSFLEEIEPAVRQWQDVYAVELAERAWLNLSFWFRWMDHFGLPRTLATRGVGGELGTPEDARILPGPFVRRMPRAFRQMWLSRRKLRDAGKGLQRLDEQISRTQGLLELYEATVAGLVLALSTNYAIAGLWSLMARVRAALHVPGTARPVTQEMMEEYSRLAGIPDPAGREVALERWLVRFGHRGPLESDLSQPRFAELRPVLLRDLAAAGGAAAPPAPAGQSRFLAWLTQPFYKVDARREWFRDATMRRWQRLRGRILEEGARLVAAGDLDRVEDVFWLAGRDLRRTDSLQQAVASARARADIVRDLDLPLTASREQIQELLKSAGLVRARQSGRRVFPGIALGPAIVEGPALKAESLLSLLSSAGQSGNGIAADAILVVPSLEPSWAVIFPRVAGVVAEVGGELSHASILLREARKPAVVNCAGIFHQVRTGDRLRLDGTRGLVEMLS